MLLSNLLYSFDPTSRLREHSLTGTTRTNLRDSAIELVSDDDNSEAYTAVSLAGKLGSAHKIRVNTIVPVVV